MLSVKMPPVKMLKVYMWLVYSSQSELKVIPKKQLTIHTLSLRTIYRNRFKANNENQRKITSTLNGVLSSFMIDRLEFTELIEKVFMWFVYSSPSKLKVIPKPWKAYNIYSLFKNYLSNRFKANNENQSKSLQLCRNAWRPFSFVYGRPTRIQRIHRVDRKSVYVTCI
jgi:ribosomal protein S14